MDGLDSCGPQDTSGRIPGLVDPERRNSLDLERHVDQSPATVYVQRER